MIFTTICSYANDLNVINLSEHKWEYRWGDSPFKDGIPVWTIEENSNSKWQVIDFPSNPPNRDGKTNVWYRIKLPNTLTKDPHLYIFSVDVITQVYFKGKQIYHFGELNNDGKGKFAGWPWHMITLPEDVNGEYLYFRIYSDFHDIGLWGEVLIASKGEILKRLLDYDIPKIMVGSISIFVSILFLLSFLSKLKRGELFILGLLFLTQGLNVLCSVKVIELYLFYPLLNQYILAIAFFFFPVGMGMYLDKTIKIKTPFNIIRKLWQIHLVYIFGAVIGSTLGYFEVPSTYEYFDIFYNFISLPIFTICIVYFFFKGDNQVKLITSSFFIITLYWLYSSLIAYNLVPWVEYPSDAAVFICLLLLSYSIVKNLNYTTELEDKNQELSILSSTDYLTKLNNRKELDALLKKCENIFKRYKDSFSIILLDIDDFKKVNDIYGHLVGDKFLIELGELLRTFTREADFIGRWGGEEFLMICPKTTKDEAAVVAEHLRMRIEKHDFEDVGKKTASFGISTIEENDDLNNLISRADEALYLSKSQGKNKVSIK